MHTLRLATFAVLAVFLPWNSSVLAAEGIPGNIRVIKVKGTVSHINATTQTSEPLKEGTFVRDNHSVKTGADSMAVLLFSNGTTIVVRPNSVFSKQVFTQVPFDSSNVQYNNLKEEPSVSQTKVSVTEGSIIANVAKLQKGSTMDIGTPVGVAGIRGTIIQVSISRPGAGPQSVTISLPEGSAVFTTLNGRTLTLSDGSVITISDATPGAQPTQLTPQEAAEIEALIAEALAQLPQEGAFEGVQEGSPETGGTGDDGEGQAGGFGGDQGAGNVGTAPGGGTGGGNGGSSGGGSSATPTPTPTATATPTPTPTPNPPVS